MDRKPGHLTRNIDKVASSLVWVKVVGIGDAGVGKTCLIKHFCESKFTSGYQPTVGVDYGFKIQTIKNIDLRVHLWDLSGHPEYADVRNELYAGTDAVFLVYDVTQRRSFDSLDAWLREVQRYSSGPRPPVVAVVANKCDQKSKRVVPPADGQKWAAVQKIRYFETSCSSGEGTEAMFNALLETVVQQNNLSAKET